MSEEPATGGIDGKPGESLVAIVLAAGEGTRYGMPKAQVEWGGRSWVEIAVESLRRAGFESIRVVTGAGSSPEIERGAAGPHLEFLYNPDWRSGRTGSIQRGLRDLPPGCEGVLLHQVDFPWVRASTFEALCRAFEADQLRAERILVPAQAGRRGHPIVIGGQVWHEILRLKADEPLHLVVRREPGRVREILVDDPGIHRNCNRPEDGDRPNDQDRPQGGDHEEETA